MKSIAITGNTRTDLGKKATKAVRSEGNVPCVIYGGENVVHFTAGSKGFKHLVYTPDFKTAQVSVDGNNYNCIVKAIQFHPVTDEILHMDFLELVNGAKMRVEIPIRFQGVAPGTRAGGKITQKLRRVKVKTTPEFLKDELFVDVSSLQLGQSVKVRDIILGEGMELETSSGIPVASVEVPRALRSAQADGEEEGTTEATEE
ncbi:MAG: large subunit ribosomal protein L25 [Saprospiraceae bacterium]|jgi:large subunit ribosomal protein L25